MAFHHHDGSVWVETLDHVHDGSLWTDNDAELYVHDGSSWVLIQPDGVTPPPPDDFPPPFNLAIDSVADSSVTVTWELPVSSPTPTEVQFRILEVTTVFDVYEYPATTASRSALQPDTDYTFQVRLVHRTDGVADVFSTIAEIGFTTTETEVPLGPFVDPDGSGGDSTFIPPTIGGSAFPGTPGTVGSANCSWEWKIQTFASGVWADMAPPVEGSYAGTVHVHPFDLATLTPPGSYRYCVREVCNLIPGAWHYGNPFSTLSDWADVCADSPVSFDYTDTVFGYPDAVFYVPQVCTPDVIHDAVTGDALIKGAGFSGTFITSDDPEGNWQIGSLLSYDDGAAQQSVVEGSLSALSGLVPGDFSISFKLNLTDAPAGRTLLLSLGGNAIVFVAESAALGLGYSLAVETYTTAGFLNLQALSPTAIFPGDDHTITLRWDDDGPKQLFIDGVQEALNLAGDAYAHATISDQVVAYLPADARIWSIAGWDRLLTDDEISPPPTAPVIVWDYSDTAHPGSLTVATDDVIVIMSAYRDTSVTAATAPSLSGSATMSAPTSIGGTFTYDNFGTSRGTMRCDWYKVTAGGSLTVTHASSNAHLIAQITGVDTTTPLSNPAVNGIGGSSSPTVNIAGTNVTLAMLVAADDSPTSPATFTPSNSLVVGLAQNVNGGVYDNHLFGLSTETPESALAGTVSIGTSGGHGGYVFEMNPV